jgi:hypothetical protein
MELVISGSILTAAGAILSGFGGINSMSDRGSSAAAGAFLGSGVPLLVAGQTSISVGASVWATAFQRPMAPLAHAELIARTRRARDMALGGSISAALSLAFTAVGGATLGRSPMSLAMTIVGSIGIGPSTIVFAVGLSRWRELRRLEAGGTHTAVDLRKLPILAPWVSERGAGVTLSGVFE